MTFKLFRREKKAYGMFDLQKATWVGSAEGTWPGKGRGPRARHVQQSRRIREQLRQKREQEQAGD